MLERSNARGNVLRRLAGWVFDKSAAPSRNLFQQNQFQCGYQGANFVKLKRHRLFECRAKFREHAFADGGVSLIDKCLGYCQYPRLDAVLAGNQREAGQRREIIRHHSRCRDQLLLVVPQPEQVFRIGSPHEGRIHTVKYALQRLRKLLATFRQ